MTVEGYKCRWFDDKNKLTEDVFTEAELETFTKPTGSSVRFAKPMRGI